MNREQLIKAFEGIIRKRVQYQYHPKEKCFIIGSPNDIATALVDSINILTVKGDK